MSMPPTTTMAGMPMSTSTDGSSGITTMMGMNEMAMTFFTSTSTPLFSNSWTPASTGQYAGTCIALIVLATTFRALLAVRLNIIEILAAIERRHSGVGDYPYIAGLKPTAQRPWRAKEAVMLASMDVVLAGVGYLLYGLHTDNCSRWSLTVYTA
jgi:copper transporter 1